MMDKLNQFGHSFQIKVITSLLTDKSFIQQVSDILYPDFFESEANNWIVSEIQTYYMQFKSIPTLDVFKIKLQEVEKEVLKSTVVETLKEVYKLTKSEDLDFVKQETVKFCRNQCLKKAILESADLLRQGDYDSIKKTIDSALKAGHERNVGYNLLEGIIERYTENVRSTIPTPWPLINDLSAGGFGKGELILFVAPPGIGKSTALMNIGAHSVQKGMNVVHYTMELSEAYTAQRYDAIITGIATQNLKYNLEEVEQELHKKVTGNLTIKYYPTKTASVNTLKAHLDQLILLGTKPDLVVIDYADLLRGTSRTREKLHEDLEIIYEELRGLAGEYEIPVFSASQSNRSSADSDIVTGDQIASSFAKIMVADFIISLSRKVTDKIAGTGRFFVIKNRFGPDGITLPSRINMSNGRMEIFEETSVQGKATKKEMESGDSLLKKSLLQKYNEISGTSLG
jgi:replicative DNA helicase